MEKLEYNIDADFLSQLGELLRNNRRFIRIVIGVVAFFCIKIIISLVLESFRPSLPYSYHKTLTQKLDEILDHIKQTRGVP